MQDSVAVQQNLILDGWDGICHQGAEIPVSLNCLGDNCFAGGWSQSPLDDCISLPQAQNLLDGHFGLHDVFGSQVQDSILQPCPPSRCEGPFVYAQDNGSCTDNSTDCLDVHLEFNDGNNSGDVCDNVYYYDTPHEGYGESECASHTSCFGVLNSGDFLEWCRANGRDLFSEACDYFAGEVFSKTAKTKCGQVIVQYNCMSLVDATDAASNACYVDQVKRASLELEFCAAEVTLVCLQEARTPQASFATEYFLYFPLGIFVRILVVRFGPPSKSMSLTVTGAEFMFPLVISAFMLLSLAFSSLLLSRCLSQLLLFLFMHPLPKAGIACVQAILRRFHCFGTT